MPQYRLKTELVDAVQYTGSQAQAEQITQASTNVFPLYKTEDGEQVWTGNLNIKTPTGFDIVEPTDYIMTREDGSRFKVSAADFITKYEVV